MTLTLVLSDLQAAVQAEFSRHSVLSAVPGLAIAVAPLLFVNTLHHITIYSLAVAD